MARTTGPAARSVASRLFAIVDVFADGSRTLSLTDVARRSSLPTSTAARLLGELVHAGWLTRRASDGRYQVGIRLWQLGQLAPSKRELRDAAAPFLQDLYDAARQNVQLIVLDSGAGLCVERVYGMRALPTELDVGDRVPLHATATGKALLAFASHDVVEAVLANPLARYTGATITDPGRLRKQLARIRETGLAISHEERRKGSAGIAAPIRTRDDGLLGAVGVVAPVSAGIDRFGLAVRTVALAIGRATGRVGA